MFLVQPKGTQDQQNPFIAILSQANQNGTIQRDKFIII